jgi:hypothetical protein
MGMVRSRFCTLPEVFNACLVPRSTLKEKKGVLPSFLEKKIFKVEFPHVLITLKVLSFLLVISQMILIFRT